MNIKEKFIHLKDSGIDFILNHLDSSSKLPAPSQHPNSYNQGGYVDLSSLSPEEREKAFIDFAEGDSGLFSMLTTAYEHGIESMFCCKGHSTNDFGYAIFKVTDDNLKQLQQLGKVLSHKGVSTDFEHHHKFGFRVTFHSFHCSDRSWFYDAAETIKNPPHQEILPTMYYHETPYNSFQPLSFRIKKRVINTLKKWRTESFGESDESPNSQLSKAVAPKTLSEKLKEEFPPSPVTPIPQSQARIPNEVKNTPENTDLQINND